MQKAETQRRRNTGIQPRLCLWVPKTLRLLTKIGTASLARSRHTVPQGKHICQPAPIYCWWCQATCCAVDAAPGLESRLHCAAGSLGKDTQPGSLCWSGKDVSTHLGKRPAVVCWVSLREVHDNELVGPGLEIWQDWHTLHRCDTRLCRVARHAVGGIECGLQQTQSPGHAQKSQRQHVVVDYKADTLSCVKPRTTPRARPHGRSKQVRTG